MKKIIALALALVLCVVLVACGAKEETGAKIAAQKGTTSFMYADALKNTKVTTYDTFALAAKDMINGNADYLFVDKTTAKALQKEIAGLKIIEIALSSENYGIGIVHSRICRVYHIVAKAVLGSVESGGIKEDKLGLAPCADTYYSVSCGLGFF